jgi:hypothetical protein
LAKSVRGAVIGSIRQECLDHVIITGEAVSDASSPNMSLLSRGTDPSLARKDTPAPRRVQPPAKATITLKLADCTIVRWPDARAPAQLSLSREYDRWIERVQLLRSTLSWLDPNSDDRIIAGVLEVRVRHPATASSLSAATLICRTSRRRCR